MEVDIYLIAVMLVSIGLQLGLFRVLFLNTNIKPQDIARALGNYEGGIASGTARQKKKADSIMGEALLEQFPVIRALSERFPQLGQFLIQNPNMVPYVGSQLSSIAGGFVSDRLPPEIATLISGFMGEPPPSGTPSQRPKKESGW